jgi:hypothetical protein
MGQWVVAQNAHIVAVDILYNSKHPQPYAVLEVNACPSLSIEDNVAKVVETLRGR